MKAPTLKEDNRFKGQVILQADPVDRPEDRYSGIKALWAKVIIRAVFDRVMYWNHPNLKERSKALDADTWLFKKSNLPNSFETVCSFLEIDPEDVRQRALRMKKSEVAKIEHMERGGRLEVSRRPVIQGLDTVSGNDLEQDTPISWDPSDSEPLAECWDPEYDRLCYGEDD